MKKNYIKPRLEEIKLQTFEMQLQVISKKEGEENDFGNLLAPEMEDDMDDEEDMGGTSATGRRRSVY